MKSLAICVLLALLALPSAGLEVHLVKDIRTGPLDSDPSHLVTLGDAVLFVAFSEDGTFGPDLWRSDGTAGGTWRLTEDAVAPVRLTERLYFFSDLESALWVTDGTTGGTFQLTPPGVLLDLQSFLTPNLWIPSQGVLYFLARDEHGQELWRSDGTVAGTHLVKDIRPGAEGSDVKWLTEYRGQVWFFADDGEHGFALWRSDGTPAGTTLAIDLPPLPPLTDPQPIHVVGGRLAFFAPNRHDKLQLWAGDGTADGTWPITNLSGKKGKRPAILGSDVRAGRLYFVAEDRRGQELWVSDGTGRGTRPLTAFQKPDALAVSPENLFPLQRDGVVNGRLLFRADDGIHGIEPWITDGTPQGTRLLRDLCPGACSSFVDPWYVLDGRLYFTNQAEERELWSTDGTPAGTRLVSGGFFNLHSPIVAGDRLFFVGRDAESSEEIWSTNAAGDGIVRVTNFETPFLWEAEGLDAAVLHGMLLFPATDAAHGRELWVITP